MLRKKDPDTFIDYLQDNSGLPLGSAEEIVFPESEKEAAAYLQEAASKKMPVTISGAGTGIVGGRIPFGGTILSTDRLDKVIDIQKFSKRPGGTACIEPGISLEQLCKEAYKYGLTYLPDPTEKNAFMGGTIATNASGAKGFKYGATRMHILGLHVILSSGQVLDIKRGNHYIKDRLYLPPESGIPLVCAIPNYSLPNIKNTAGYYIYQGSDLIDLFIGSEGTLGLVSEIKVALSEIPQQDFTGVVFFKGQAQALEFVFDLKKQTYISRSKKDDNGIDAVCIEYFDEYSLKILRRKYSKISSQAKAAVYFSQDIFSQKAMNIMEKYADLLENAGIRDDQVWFLQTSSDKEFVNEMRYDLPVLINERVKKNGFSKISTDIAVSDEHFPAMVAFYESILKNSKIPYCVFGHIGENHLHVNLMPESVKDFNGAKNIYLEFINKAINLGGTVSAEHGIGKLKREYIEIMLGHNGLKEMAVIKKTIDPGLILNKGTIFDEMFLKHL